MASPYFSDNETKLQPLLEQLDHLTYGLMAGVTQKDFEEDTQAWKTRLQSVT